MDKRTFSGNNGRFEIKFIPVLDRNSYTNVELISTVQHWKVQ